MNSTSRNRGGLGVRATADIDICSAISIAASYVLTAATIAADGAAIPKGGFMPVAWLHALTR